MPPVFRSLALACLSCIPPLWAETPTKSDLAAAATAAFPAGTYGEPYSVEALLQGCGDTEVGYACTFYAEGARWIAAKDGPSNAAALDVLDKLPVNAPLIISGDMVSFGDITVDAAIATVAPAQPDAYASLRDLSQGSWVDSTDPKSALQITGSEESASYASEYLGTSIVTYSDSCPGIATTDGPVVIKQMMGEDPLDLPCYAILDITTDSMELSYVGRGNTLTYIRP
jgi:hypothetical protein